MLGGVRVSLKKKNEAPYFKPRAGKIMAAGEEYAPGRELDDGISLAGERENALKEYNSAVGLRAALKMMSGVSAGLEE